MSFPSGRRKFFLRNLVKGLTWMGAIIGFFLLLRYSFGVDFHHLIETQADNALMVLLIFLVSEVVFGIIPPEVFMLWAAGSTHFLPYGLMMLLLGFISYGAGVTGYYIGRKLHSTAVFKIIYQRFLEKQASNLRKYGYFLIIVAAMTPLPFSAICMLAGAVGYPQGSFFLVALTRFLRFTLYAWIMLEVSNLWFLV